MAVIIDGTAIAEKVRNEVRSGISDLVRERGEAARPSMALILVGNNMVSHNLVRMKAHDCEQVGIIPRIIELPEETHEDAMLSFIETLNRDDSVNAILCQLPVPQQISTKKLLVAIDTSKDVDGFTARIDADKTDIAACTPAGIMRMLREYGIDVKGKHCVVVGRSNIVGKPMAMQLLLHDATVTVCHSKTQNLSSFTKQADILIVAVGHARLITADMVKEGAVVIDVGMNYPEGKPVGDVDFAEVSKRASYISPGPGGVGPMTRAYLLKNCLELAKQYRR